ncbi:MAG: cyclic nucleotide-binding domain-containing protein [Gammaproteobacteria bacterium]|nr:cyclic nucleotide-binding domain-containing protein [Gammaproteobacteria bacterium]
MTASQAIEEKFSSVLRMLVPINGLSVPRRQQLFAQAEVLGIRRGSYVFHEGDKDSYAFFLLEGSLELFAGQQLVKRIAGGSVDAIHPLAQLQPRQLSARALSEAHVLRVSRDLLDKLLALDGTGDSNYLKIDETDPDEESDWMTRMLQSELFSRVPAANIQRIFVSLESVEYKASDVVVRQGGPGDFYYVIQTGRCQVSRQIPNGKVPIKLAELGPGDTFGEEALVAEATRNATVTMLTGGTLMRLTKEDFVELIKKPLLNEISHREAQHLVANQGAVWLDVRFPEEHRAGSIEASLNLPLNTLRMHAERLDRDKMYIVCCDTGSRSSVGAFLLSERGFDVFYLSGGMVRHGLLTPALDEINDSFPAKPRPPVRQGSTGVSVTPVSAVVPSSQKSEAERQHAGVLHAINNDVLDADLRAQALKTELAKANIQLNEARNLKEQAEQARLETERVAALRLEAERTRLAQDAEHARQAVEEARRLKVQLEQARQEAQQLATRARDKESEDLLAANRQLQEAHRVKLEVEAARAQMESELRERLASEQAKLAAETEAERRKLEAEAARLRAELEAEHRTARMLAAQAREQESASAETVNAQLEEVRRLKADAETARADLERAAAARLEEEKSRIAEDAERARSALEEAQRIKGELENSQAGLTREVETRLEAKQRELQAEAERTRLALEEAQRLKEDAEAVRANLAREAEARLREQQGKLEAEAAQARLAWEEAQRLKAQVELDKQRAEEDAARQRAEALAELQEANFRLEAAQRARAEAEDARMLLEKQAALRIIEEQACLADEAAKTQRMWEDAQRFKEQIETEKRQADEEAALRHRDEEARIQTMRAEAERRLREEERKLEESYAWQAEELARLQRMKEETEQQLVLERARLKSDSEEARSRLAEAKRIQVEVEEARVASAEEAQTRELRQLELERRLRDEIQAKVDGERRKLEAEFARNAEELERAQQERAAAEAARNAAAEEAERIIQEFKQSHQDQRVREEEKLRIERERLERESAQLRAALQEAQQAQEHAALIQQRLESQLQELATSRAADRTLHSERESQLTADVAAIEAEVGAARANAAEEEAAHRRVLVAASINEASLEQHRQEEGAIRSRFEQEITSWLSEQDEIKNSQLSRQVFANQRAHLDRIKQRAQAARTSAKAHDQALIEDLAAHLKRPD